MKKVKKIVLSEVPKEIHHNGIVYSGDEILKCFTIAALEQSGDLGEDTNAIPDINMVQKKRMVMMLKKGVVAVAADGDDNEEDEKLLLPNGGSSDEAETPFPIGPFSSATGSAELAFPVDGCEDAGEEESPAYPPPSAAVPTPFP